GGGRVPADPHPHAAHGRLPLAPRPYLLRPATDRPGPGPSVRVPLRERLAGLGARRCVGRGLRPFRGAGALGRDRVPARASDGGCAPCRAPRRRAGARGAPIRGALSANGSGRTPLPPSGTDADTTRASRGPL